MVAKNFPSPVEIGAIPVHKQIVLYMEGSLYNRLRELALAQDWSMSNCAINLIKIGLREKERANEPQ